MTTSSGFGRPVFITLFAFALVGDSGSAQATPRSVVIPDRVSCAACEIRLRPTVRLGDNDGDGSMTRMANAAIQDSRGRTYVTLYAPPALAYLFDSTGKFVRRIGRLGAGPGEYNSAFLVQGSHDSLAILDYFNQRRSILAPGGGLVRTTPMPVLSPTAIRLSGGQQLVSGIGGFSIVNNDGVFVRSVGKPLAAKPGSRIASVRPSSANMFWTFDAASYAVEQRRLDGNVAQILERNSTFFPAAEKQSSGTDGTKPTPRLQDIYEDATGVLWTITLVPSADWEQWLGPNGTDARFPYQKTRKDHLYDSIIEVFDAKRGILLQSTRVGGYFNCFLRDNVVGQHVEDDDGYTYLQLHRIELIRR